MNEFDYEQISKIVCNNIQDVIKSLVQPNLENVISSDFSSNDLKGEDTMASKFKERVKVGTDDNGKAIYGWATGDTKEELHRSIAMLLSKSSTPPVKQESAIQIPTWEDCAQSWFNTFHLPNLAPKTVPKSKSLFKNHIKPAFEGVVISSIKTSDVQNYLQTKERYCKTQVRDIMWMLKSIFASACDDGYIQKNPMDSSRISNPSQKEITERQVLSQQEQADIISHLGDITNVMGRLYMAFLMFTCMRPCEILGLRWDDLTNNKRTACIKRDLVFVNGKTVIGDTKTEKSKRQFPISNDLLYYINQTPQSTGYIFGKNGQPISSESVYRKMWRDIKKEIDVHGMTPYVGRHTYATNMSRAGIPIKTAMDLMGHTDERMLLRTYTHSNEEDLLAATNTMSNYFASLGPSSPNYKTQSHGM